MALSISYKICAGVFGRPGARVLGAGVGSARSKCGISATLLHSGHSVAQTQQTQDLCQKGMHEMQS